MCLTNSLPLFLKQDSISSSVVDQLKLRHKYQPEEPEVTAAPRLPQTTHPSPSTTTPAPSTTPIPTTKPDLVDDFLGPKECLRQKFTWKSCVKAFCPPWMRCVDGACVCKLPYMCLRIGSNACGYDGRRYLTHCQAMASSCRYGKKVFSHFGEKCDGWSLSLSVSLCRSNSKFSFSKFDLSHTIIKNAIRSCFRY